MEEAALKKLQLLKAETRLIINLPENLAEGLKEITFDAKPTEAKKGEYDLILAFGTDKATLKEMTNSVANFGQFDCLFWLCYPKGTGKIKSDLKREVVWQILQDIELKAVTQIAIDDTWSALRGRPKLLYS